MALNSFFFLLGFLPCVVMGVHLLRDRYSARAAQVLVLLASMAFYVASGPRYLPVLLLSVAFNWGVGRAFDSPRLEAVGRKRLLVFGLTVDVLILCFFKYVNFLLGVLRPTHRSRSGISELGLSARRQLLHGDAGDVSRGSVRAPDPGEFAVRPRDVRVVLSQRDSRSARAGQERRRTTWELGGGREPRRQARSRNRLPDDRSASRRSCSPTRSRG